MIMRHAHRRRSLRFGRAVSGPRFWRDQQGITWIWESAPDWTHGVEVAVLKGGNIAERESDLVSGAAVRRLCARKAWTSSNLSAIKDTVAALFFASGTGRWVFTGCTGIGVKMESSEISID